MVRILLPKKVKLYLVVLIYHPRLIKKVDRHF